MRAAASFAASFAATVAAVGVMAACAPPDVCGAGGTRAPTPTSPSPRAGLLARAHAHNDYEHERPLEDALDAGFLSVEVDVWHRGGTIAVSHDPFTSRGELAGLYLAPLDARLREQGTVYGDGEAFTVWLDLKDGRPELRALLRDTLESLPWLRHFDDDDEANDSAEEGAVTVIITGDGGSKRALLDEVPAPRPFLVDDNDVPHPESDIDAGVGAFALNFNRYLGSWDGIAPAPDELRSRGACIVARAHGERRRPVRFFGGPDTTAAWDLALDIGADFINTDDLAGLAAHLAGR